MSARFEVTKKYARAYDRAPKKDKARILDTVVAVTGWNRDHARQQLRRRLRQAPGRATATVAVIDRRKTKARKCSRAPELSVSEGQELGDRTVGVAYIVS